MKKRKVFRQQRDEGGIPWGIILRTAGGLLFQSEGLNTAKAQCLNKEVRD